MAGFYPRKDELYIEDENKTIHMTLEGEKYLGWHTTPDGKTVDDYDRNLIEFSYYEDDEDGMGAGVDEFITTYDIKNMADGIRNVIFHRTNEFRYYCLDSIFWIEVCYDKNSDTYSFTAALLETLSREYHITITKERLTLSGLEEYTQAMLEWEKRYPVV